MNSTVSGKTGAVRITNHRLRDMDEYSAHLSGENMDLHGVTELLGMLDVRKALEKGQPMGGRPGHTYPETSCIIDAPGYSLKALLECLANVRPELVNLGVTEINISALMERGTQINGELHSDEIGLLAVLNAHYSWSVMYTEEPC